MGPVSYVCGGVAEDERQALAAQEQNFNMGVLFTRGENGEYTPTCRCAGLPTAGGRPFPSERSALPDTCAGRQLQY